MGNIGIAAHRDTFFRPLRRIQRSDLLILSTAQGHYLYRVVSAIVVSPEVVQVLYPTANDSLTLVTCFPFDYIGPAPKRFIVQASGITGMASESDEPLRLIKIGDDGDASSTGQPSVSSRFSQCPISGATTATSPTSACNARYAAQSASWVWVFG